MFLLVTVYRLISPFLAVIDPNSFGLVFTNCLLLPDEILECVAKWKEGSSRYLVGRIMSQNKRDRTGNRLTGNAYQSANTYQCFRYERHYDKQKGGIVVKMAQSYSGACEGLWSAEEGDRTYTFWTGNFLNVQG